MFFLIAIPGGDVWIDGEAREGGVYSRADETLSSEQGLCQTANHQQKDQRALL